MGLQVAGRASCSHCLPHEADDLERQLWFERLGIFGFGSLELEEHLAVFNDFASAAIVLYLRVFHALNKNSASLKSSFAPQLVERDA